MLNKQQAIIKTSDDTVQKCIYADEGRDGLTVMFEQCMSRCIQYILATGDKSHIDDLVQDCSNSSGLAMELLESCTKPSIKSIYKSTL